jgi:hypothetical protein
MSTRKTLWTLNIDSYAPEICELTYPLLLAYARKIGADFRIINERRFPEWPVTYEKLQIFELGQSSDWNIFVDSDAVLFPDLFDVTERIPKDTVVHQGQDHAGNRWRYDDFFRRDGRDIGSCNWFTVASNWCLDLWHPLEDLSLREAVDRINPILIERNAGVTPEHLIDDYTLSRNIARYGLKFKTVGTIQKENNDPGQYFWHTHRLPVAEKAKQIREGLSGLKMIPWTENIPKEGWIAAYGAYVMDHKGKVTYAGSAHR